MNQLHPIIQQAIAPMFHAQIAQLTQEQRREIDDAMLQTKRNPQPQINRLMRDEININNKANG